MHYQQLEFFVSGIFRTVSYVGLGCVLRAVCTRICVNLVSDATNDDDYELAAVSD